MLITAFPEKDASRPPTADSQVGGGSRGLHSRFRLRERILTSREGFAIIGLRLWLWIFVLFWVRANQKSATRGGREAYCCFRGYTSDGASIHSELEGYVYENGRQYHSYRSGKYLLPCDQREIERMEVYHHIWLVLLGGRLHIAPLVEPKRILDVGTGNGEWALNMAEYVELLPGEDVGS